MFKNAQNAYFNQVVYTVQWIVAALGSIFVVLAPFGFGVFLLRNLGNLPKLSF